MRGQRDINCWVMAAVQAIELSAWISYRPPMWLASERKLWVKNRFVYEIFIRFRVAFDVCRSFLLSVEWICIWGFMLSIDHCYYLSIFNVIFWSDIQGTLTLCGTRGPSPEVQEARAPWGIIYIFIFNFIITFCPFLHIFQDGPRHQDQDNILVYLHELSFCC